MNAEAYTLKRRLRICAAGTIAGLAGGFAEIAWIALYKNVSGGDAAAVARGVTETLFPSLVPEAAALPLGIAIHMCLAVTLGIAIAVFMRSLWPRAGSRALEPVVVIGLLICVWATNFFLVLPAMNPAFVTLVPYTASLASKILFGGAAALALQLFDGPYPAQGRELKGAV